MIADDIKTLKHLQMEMLRGYCTSERGFQIVQTIIDILLRLGTENE